MIEESKQLNFNKDQNMEFEKEFKQGSFVLDENLLISSFFLKLISKEYFPNLRFYSNDMVEINVYGS